jgi:hypothetical protein
MSRSIPTYRADGSFYANMSGSELAKAQSSGLVAHVVRHRKGYINRAYLRLRPGAPRALSVGDLLGTRYSYRERLAHGPAWDLKHLGADPDSQTYAAPEARDAFLQVVRECLRPPGQIGDPNAHTDSSAVGRK